MTVKSAAPEGKAGVRVADAASCPTHGTTSITSGSPDTFFEHHPAVRVGDRTTCGDTITQGSNNFLINGKPAAFTGCFTAHSGNVTSGASTILIGPDTDQPDQAETGANYSMSFDFSDMHQAGNHNGMNFAGMAVEITGSDGRFITTLWTDGYGVTGSVFTETAEDITAWVVGADDWEVIEEEELVEVEEEETDHV